MFLFVLFIVAVTFIIPFISYLKSTNISWLPFFPGGIPSKTTCPIFIFSETISESPSYIGIITLS